MDLSGNFRLHREENVEALWKALGVGQGEYKQLSKGSESEVVIVSMDMLEDTVKLGSSRRLVDLKLGQAVGLEWPQLKRTASVVVSRKSDSVLERRIVLDSGKEIVSLMDFDEDILVVSHQANGVKAIKIYKRF